MMNEVMHWATCLIGLPWSPQFNCWALVQQVFSERYGIAMPSVDLVHEGNVRAIKQAAEVSGWVRVEGPALDGDIVVMQGLRGRHVGVMIEIGFKLLLLHNRGHMTPRGPVGGVVAQTLDDVAHDGYQEFQYWRRAP